jgi:hypothetical protein
MLLKSILKERRRKKMLKKMLLMPSDEKFKEEHAKKFPDKCKNIICRICRSKEFKCYCPMVELMGNGCRCGGK